MSCDCGGGGERVRGEEDKLHTAEAEHHAEEIDTRFFVRTYQAACTGRSQPVLQSLVADCCEETRVGFWFADSHARF